MDEEWVTTSTLLVRLSDDDERAWVKLADRFRAPIVAYARSLGLAEPDAQDAAQETLLAFVRLYREGRFERDRGALSRWLFGIADRQIKGARARVQRVGDREGTPAASAFWERVADAQPTELWDREWGRALLSQCVERARRETAPETFRMFELVVHDELAPAEAARRLGVPVKAVYNAKHRVLARIRELRERLEATA